MLRQFVISEQYGLYAVRGRHGQLLGRGTTLEAAIAKAAPTAPADKVFATAEVLEPLLGEKVEDPEAPVVP